MKLNRTNILLAAGGVFGLYLFIHYWPSAAALFSALLGAASPLLIGAVIAYILNIPMRGFERLFFPRTQKKALIRLRRPLCMTAAFLATVAVVALIIALIVPQLYDCIVLIINIMPGVMESLLEQIKEWGILPEDILSMLEDIDWQSRIEQIVNVVYSGIGSVMEIVINTISSVFSGLVTALLSLIFAFYLLLGQSKLKSQWKRLTRRYLPERMLKRTNYVLSVLNKCFHRYIVGQCMEALILGVLCTIGLMILGLPYAPMVGALIAFTALIPVAGAYIGAGISAFMILTVSPPQALIFLIFIVILQQLENNLIYPKVVGSSMGLPGMWVLAAVTVGGGMMGVLGMLIGVPVAAAIYQIVGDDVRKKEQEQAAAAEQEAPPEEQ